MADFSDNIKGVLVSDNFVKSLAIMSFNKSSLLKGFILMKVNAYFILVFPLIQSKG